METARKLRTVIVLYHPDDAAIGMVEGVARDGGAPVAVVNAIDPARLATLRATGAELIVNPANIGLAAALNQGIDRALAAGADHVMLLDQDTRPPAGMAKRLIAVAEAIAASGRRVGCVGPVPVDRKRPEAGTLARRTGAPLPGIDAVEVATVISSGQLIPRAAIEAAGGMWDALFIDHIDHEWCFRARAAGLGIYAATGVPMPHDMGDVGISLFGRYKPVHRSPVRHFHIVRNTLWLARLGYIPLRWRLAEVAKLALRVPAYLAFSASLAQSLGAVIRAVKAGARRPPALPRT